MYLWNINGLNNELISGDLAESEKFKYLFASSALYALAAIQYSTPNKIDIWSGVVTCFVTLIGLFYIYKINGGEKGENFLARYLSISWVVFIRMLVLLLLPSIILILVAQEIFMGGIPDESTNIDFAYIIAIEIVYVLWVAKHMNNVVRGSDA